MTARQPLADIAAEARQVLDGCAAHQVSARLIGGLAVAQHQHLPTPPELQRPPRRHRHRDRPQGGPRG